MIYPLLNQYAPKLPLPAPGPLLNRQQFRALLKKVKALGNHNRVHSKSGYNHKK